jgi:hypothetical protein
MLRNSEIVRFVDSEVERRKQAREGGEQNAICKEESQRGGLLRHLFQDLQNIPYSKRQVFSIPVGACQVYARQFSVTR